MGSITPGQVWGAWGHRTPCCSLSPNLIGLMTPTQRPSCLVSPAPGTRLLSLPSFRPQLKLYLPQGSLPSTFRKKCTHTGALRNVLCVGFPQRSLSHGVRSFLVSSLPSLEDTKDLAWHPGLSEPAVSG